MKKYHNEKLISKDTTDITFIEQVEAVLQEKKRILRLTYLN